MRVKGAATEMVLLVVVNDESKGCCGIDGAFGGGD